MDYLLGLDAGTTAFKAVLFDGAGRAVASAMQEYTLEYPAADRVELDPEIYWQACRAAIRDVLAKWSAPLQSIRALAISSQGETLIAVDRWGSPLRKAIVWLDNRAEAEAAILKEEFGVKHAYKITGQPDIVPTWPAAKILWLQRHEPQVFAGTHKFLLLEDYLIYRFTGCFVAEGAMLTSSLLFDINTGTWWPEMLTCLGLSIERLPEIFPSAKIVGELTAQAAADTGLAKTTLVVTGAMDQAAGSIGAGNVMPGVITECTGGALAVCATISRPLFDPQQRIPCHYHALTGSYYLLPWCQTAGMTLRWFRDVFYTSLTLPVDSNPVDVYEQMTRDAAAVPAGSDGIIMLPHLAGAFTPESDPRARGVYFGFSLQSTRAHFIRACLESVAFMLNRNIQLLEELGIEVQEIRSIGGGAKSPLWNQIKADVCQKQVATVETAETACLGVAMLAGQAIGLYPDLQQTCERMVKIHKRFEPQPENNKVYSQAFSKYVDLFQAVKELF